MANKVTAEDIKKFNELYYKYHTFAEVARQTGFSSSTVSRYVDKNYQPILEENIKRFNLYDVPEFSTQIFEGVDNYGDLCVLSNEEKEEIKELWKELSI